jgi:hypothetical protein
VLNTPCQYTSQCRRYHPECGAARRQGERAAWDHIDPHTEIKPLFGKEKAVDRMIIADDGANPVRTAAATPGRRLYVQATSLNLFKERLPGEERAPKFRCDGWERN